MTTGRGRNWWLAGAGATAVGVLAYALWSSGGVPRVTPSGDSSSPYTLGPEVWSIEQGDGGWGNNELQTYTSDAVDLGDYGSVTITARISGSGDDTRYDSGRLTTATKWSFTEGRVTARIKLPEGQGLLPAFWLMGDDLYTVGWPRSGEIDVVETPNSTSRSVHSLHGPLTGSYTEEWKYDNTVAHDAPLAAGYHDFSVERWPGRVVIRVDGEIVLDKSADSLSDGKDWVFDGPFHLVLSLAIGGNWPGDPDETTPRESTMSVEWIRYEPAGPQPSPSPVSASPATSG